MRRVLILVFPLTFAAVSLSQAPSRNAAILQQLDEAVEAAEHGQFERAKAIDDALLRAHPGLVPALKLRGSLLEQSGHADEAAGVYAIALRSAPNDSGLLMKLGLHALAHHDYEHAVDYLQHYSRLRPTDSDGLWYLAQAYYLNAQPHLSLDTMRRCIRLVPANAQFLQKYGELLTSAGNPGEAISWLLKAEHLDPALERLDFDLALASYYQLEFSRAAQYATKATDKAPDDLSALSVLASSHEKLLEWQAAAQVYDKILALKPESPSALLGLGHCELELGHVQAAVDSIHNALHADPALPQAHFYLARAFSAMGRSADARHEAELHQRMQQMSFVPSAIDSESGKHAWQSATELIEMDHEDEAIRRLSEATPGTRRKPGDILVLAGSLCLSLGRAEQADRLLHRALQIQPDARGAHTYLGLAALQLNEFQKAESEFKAELDADPNYLPASEGLGEVCYHQQRWNEAATLLAASRTTSPAALFMLTDSYFHRGKAQDARLTAEVGAAYVRNQPEFAQLFATLLDQNGEFTLAARLFPPATEPAP